MSDDRTGERFVLDTNVLLDMLSIHDVAREAERGVDGVEYRRQRARSAVLLAGYFHEAKSQTLSLHEAFAILTRRVPREEATLERYFIETVLFFVNDHVFPGWTYNRVNGTESLVGTAADDELLRIAQSEGLVLLSNEDLTAAGVRSPPQAGSLRAKAQAADVPVFTAGELLDARGVSARAMTRGLFERWDAYAPLYVEQHRQKVGDDDIERWMSTMRDIYEWLLAPP